MSARCIFSFVVHLVMDLWYTCDALVDFDGLVDLFGWTWALIIIYVIYIVMDVWMDEIYMWWTRYICDEWDIYVIDEIYDCMNLFVMMECKKNKKLPCWITLPSVARCRPQGTRQRFFLKKIQTLPSAGKRALGKEFFFKKKIKLCRAPARGHSAKIFF